MSDRDFDIDDGNWFPLMKEMADKLMIYRLSGTEHQVFWMFMRFCYGYNKSSCDLTWKDMKDFTGLGDGTLGKSIRKLRKRNVIITVQKESKQAVSYKINSKISTWKTLSKRKDCPKGKKILSKRKVIPIIKNNKKHTTSELSKRKVNKVDKNQVQAIYDLYKNEISPLRKSSKRAKENISYHLKKHTLEDLQKSILNYQTTINGTEPQFRKDPANFFGKLEQYFIDYLPGNFEEAESSYAQDDFYKDLE